VVLSQGVDEMHRANTNPNSAKLRVPFFPILRVLVGSVYHLFPNLTVVRMPPRFLSGATPTYQPFPLPPELDAVPTPVRLPQILFFANDPVTNIIV